MQAPPQRLQAVFGHLLAVALEQMTALEQTSASNMLRAHTLGAGLWHAIDRLERFAVLQTADLRTAHTWGVTWQRWLADQLDALRCRAEPLLAGLLPEGECDARRFATRLSAFDPLASFRTGPNGIVDVAGKLITGKLASRNAQYRNREVIAGVSLRDADLSLGRLSWVKLLDLDARGANLDGAIATDAQLSGVNLARASMRAVELESAFAFDCDFTNADLVNARCRGGVVVQCSFAGADLMNLSTDRAMFMHCDFQGADLTADLDANVTMTGTQFVGCDLRWSRWHNRTLKAVRFIDCKLYEVRGAANCDGVVLDRPDLSPAGDKSRTVSLADVLALWGTSVRGPRARAAS